MTSLAGPKWIREAIKRVVAFLPCEDWIVIGWVVAIKVLLFVIGVKSYPILWDKYAPTPDRWFALWDQWDFGYYQKIAEFGYEAKNGSLAFYPLFPWLLRLVAYISGSYLAAGLIVSGIASVAAAATPSWEARKNLSGANCRSCFFGNFLATRFTSDVSMMTR